MHSFVLIAGRPTEDAERTARRALTSVQGQIELGASLQIEMLPLRGFAGALATLSPKPDYTPPLFDLAASEARTVFCFGRVTGTARAARALLEVIESEGIARARQLDGCFAALCFEPEAQRFQGFTDLIGMRSLRFVRQQGGVIVASHDLTLVATGAIGTSLDLDSVAALVACDWSIGGGALLPDVEVCDGNGLARFGHGRLTVEFTPPLSLEQRVESQDKIGIKTVLEDVAEAMEQATLAFVKEHSTIRFSLTAGKDSRTLLALLSRFEQLDLVAQTNGPSDSEDVRIASRLARRLGIRHQIFASPPPRADSFHAMTRLLSLSMNGMTNAKRALARLPDWDHQRQPLAGGEGGEIYTGFFYRSARGLALTPLSASAMASRLIQFRFRRLNSLEFSDPSCAKRLNERLVSTLRRLSVISAQPHDLLDLFYLYERYALWGAFGERNSWSRRWTPYNNVAAIRHAYRLPAPVGARCTIHELLIKRHLPLYAYLLPVNGAELLPLSGSGRLRSALRRGLKELGKHAPWRANQLHALPNAEAPKTRAAVFAHQLREYLGDSLLSSGSVAVDLFGKPGVEALLAEHVAQQNQLQVLGFLATAEAFRQQACEVHAQAHPRRDL